MHFYEIFHDFAVNVGVPRTIHDFYDNVKEVSHYMMFLVRFKIFGIFEHSKAFFDHEVNDLCCLHLWAFA